MPQLPRTAALVLLVAAAAEAQAPEVPAPLPELGQPAALPDGAPPHLAKIDRAELRTHAFWLADDARGGRHTASKGQQETAKYVADQWKKLGLKPLGDQKGYLQYYPLKRTALDPATALTFGTTKVTADFAVLAPDAVKLAAGGKFVYCGNGAPDAIPDGLAGKLPYVVLQGNAKSTGPGNDLQALQRYQQIAAQLGKHGASCGIVCLLGEVGSLGNLLNYRAVLPDHPRLAFGSDDRRRIDLAVPLVVLGPKPAALLLAHTGLDAEGTTTGKPTNDKAAGKLNLVVTQDDKATASNVVAVLEGTSKKNEAIVFSAHHDHVGRRLDGDAFNGADDNASGTAGLLEIAQAFAQGPKPERSIVFLSVSGEELGLWGSDWYGQHPTWPLERIVADINIDMIGRAAGTAAAIELQVTPSHQHDKYSSLVRDAVGLGAKFGVTFSSGDTYYARSDHFNFAKRGVPVVFFCDGEHPDYHMVTDTPDRLDYVKMEAIARLAAWTGWQAANAKGRPQELGKQAAW
ncbi:MAG: M28 family peptidase [Planctomycetes bacterium]|nr:M28 family peptidase [Planctomycetota bacterium]